PLLALLATWRSPELVARSVTTGMAMLLAPGVALMIAGGLVAHRIAQRATAALDGVAVPPRRSSLRDVIDHIAGKGARSAASARLSTVVLAIACVAVVLGVRGIPFVIACCIAVVAALAWPWSNQARQHRQWGAVAISGFESLLELSIALFAAGATPHEVASIAARYAGGDLGHALDAAVHRLALGRSISSAFGDLPVVVASPHVDAWLHAICASAELGAPATQVLHQLLADARTMRRERIRAAAATAAPRMQIALVLLVVPGIMWIMLVTTVGGLVEQLRSLGVA
ncbi:MAG: hypothetical protein JWN41_1626, partial [Thermoleophilia bacterium]|nr:hypothetical protein [Thermoleophilia bacterium]